MSSHTHSNHTAWTPHSPGWYLRLQSPRGTQACRKTIHREGSLLFHKPSGRGGSALGLIKVLPDLCLMYQKIVAQPNPVATQRCESGFGRDDRKRLLQRPSCQVISWLVSLDVKKSPLDQSHPAKKAELNFILWPEMWHYLTWLWLVLSDHIIYLITYLFSKATSRGQHSYVAGIMDQQSFCENRGVISKKTPDFSAPLISSLLNPGFKSI